MRRDADPIIVVGVLASDTLVRKPVPIRVDVYYFTFAGGFQGKPPLGL